MEVVGMSPTEAEASAMNTLGLSKVGIGLFSDEALAESIRRAASFLCPTTPVRVIRAVIEVLEGLPGYDGGTRSQLEELVDSLVGYGDLLDLPTSEDLYGARRMYLGPPSFVRRSSGSCLLIGVRPDGAQLVDDELMKIVDFEGHVRIIHAAANIEELIADSGLHEIPSDQWLREPRTVTADVCFNDFETRLSASGPCADIESAWILDPTSPVTFYKGRWRHPNAVDSGLFVTRRPQAYGSPIWCFARVVSGMITQLIDLPLSDSLITGADEAWRLQAAVDSVMGHPQKVRVSTVVPSDMTRLDFFSPLPSWAQRRLDIVGTPLLKERGSLFAYSLPSTEAEEELNHLEAVLWISREVIESKFER
jgi:hypothetical protein